MSYKQLLAIVVSICFALALPSNAQIPTINIFTRVLMVQSRYGRATIFSIDVDNREYWITAKHILTGAKHPPYGSVKEKTETLSILNPSGQDEGDQQQWITQSFSVLDPGNDIDIVVLAPDHVLLKNFPASPLASDVGVTFGGDCAFLGYAYGGAWRANFTTGNVWMPFTKRCMVSALLTDPAKAWVLDGTNNVGFSGGPVIFGAFPQEKIFAVVSGYREESAEVIASAPAAVPPVEVNVNSGFFFAYDISYAIDAIHKSPIGPMLQQPTPRATQ